jgi:predicted naringenin-chalcone synthase
VAESLGLGDQQVAASRKVLREYGNMSSVTVLFVLREILHRFDAPLNEDVCAMAFGPGLTVEMGLLEAQRYNQNRTMALSQEVEPVLA